MSLKYCIELCPFWKVSMYGLARCSINERSCSFHYARDRFLSCIEYLSEIQKGIKKHKAILKG